MEYFIGAVVALAVREIYEKIMLPKAIEANKVLEGYEKFEKKIEDIELKLLRLELGFIKDKHKL